MLTIINNNNGAKPTTKTHPQDEGWIRIKLTLRNGNPRTDKDLIYLVTMGTPELYEVAFAEQINKRASGVIRRLDSTLKKEAA